MNVLGDRCGGSATRPSPASGPGARPPCLSPSLADGSFPETPGPVFASHSLNDRPEFDGICLSV